MQKKPFRGTTFPTVCLRPTRWPVLCYDTVFVLRLISREEEDVASRAFGNVGSEV